MKDGGLTPWNAIVMCETSKTSWQVGKHHTKDDLQNNSVSVLREEKRRRSTCGTSS